MTKKLEDILNLPNVKEAFKEVDKKEKDKKIKESNGHNSSSKNFSPGIVKTILVIRLLNVNLCVDV